MSRSVTRLFLLLLSFTFIFSLQAQPPGRGGEGFTGNRQAMNIGRFYGKVVDAKGKGVGYAAVQLYAMRVDSTAGKPVETLIDGQITAENGDFSLENLPIRGNFTLKISFLGYTSIEMPVGFDRPEGGQGRRPGGGAANFDKDLGNITLMDEAQTLGEVVVEGEASSVTLALDRKVFRVDKNAMAVGGTAEDALKNVPSLSVDLNGNVTLRNASPQIFVDGRPTTLSLDQIPADAIESIEVITNPSAKYDASGGQAGIVNIVMKKDRRLGYNGNVRIGADSRGGFNTGGNINIREGKVNAFVNLNLNSFVSQGETRTERNNLIGNPPTYVLQEGNNEFQGNFRNVRAGFDWFVDNRNTLTFTGSMTRGRFRPEDVLNIRTDSLFSDRTAFSEAVRISESERGFRNTGGSVLYKHIFPKAGKELTADFNINRVTIDGMGAFETEFLSLNRQSRERQETDGTTDFVTFQMDYVEPLTKTIKFEAGIRAAVRTYDNSNANFVYDATDDEWVRRPNFADVYRFDDQVYAAYATFSQELGDWGYQVGLRAESSQYDGVLPESSTSYGNSFPLSLFPSAFLTRRLNEQDNIQLSYSRRINRPNFFQLLPFTDFSDSLNLRRGNPDLIPEFTNSLELTYQNIFQGGDNLLVSAYFKQASNLITAYQFQEFDPSLNRDLVISTYANSNSSIAYGVEITLRNSLWEWLELTHNVNLYNSRVDASNVEAELINNQFTWFAKENMLIKLPAGFILQLSGEYKSRAAFSPSDGGGRHGWRGITNTAQGYTLDRWYVDAALRKDIFKRKGTLTLSFSDVFATRQSGTHSESEFFVQDSWRIRNPQTARLTFSYRFGQPDVSLFKRKNNRVSNEGMDMMQ